MRWLEGLKKCLVQTTEPLFGDLGDDQAAGLEGPVRVIEGHLDIGGGGRVVFIVIGE